MSTKLLASTIPIPKGCFRCKKRKGLYCPYWTNMGTMVDEEVLRTFTTVTGNDGKEYFIGSGCSNFSPELIPVIFTFENVTIFEGKI